MSSETKLASGATLVINLPPFAISKALYQAVLREAKTVAFSSSTEMASIYKDIFCIAYSSPEIEACLWECFKRCTLNGAKIDADTFEPAERRVDYMQVCMEVGIANIRPFMESLSVLYQQLSSIVDKSQK